MPFETAARMLDSADQLDSIASGVGRWIIRLFESNETIRFIDACFQFIERRLEARATLASTTTTFAPFEGKHSRDFLFETSHRPPVHFGNLKKARLLLRRKRQNESKVTGRNVFPPANVEPFAQFVDCDAPV